jgi:predicted metal-binding membrane protein
MSIWPGLPEAGRGGRRRIVPDEGIKEKAALQRIDAGIHALLGRERLVVLSALAAMTGLAWAYVLHMAGMPTPGGTSMTPAPWDTARFLGMLVMWIIMMIGMMVPSAAPVVLLFAALQKKMRPAPLIYSPAALFMCGYLAVWTGFSVLATVAQWQLSEAALFSESSMKAAPGLGAVLLLLAGLYQLMPWKNACLSRCRSPVEFLVRHRRHGPLGPLVIGLHHGAYCLGCCWMLMALLFALGVMSLLWVAAITVFVFAEKAFPGGPLLSRAAGVLLLGAGALLLGAG